MATELYVSLVSHKATLLKRDKYKESEIREELNERLDVFGKVFDQLVSSLRDYEPNHPRETWFLSPDWRPTTPVGA